MSKLRWALPDQGVLFVVSGPSGVGKSTLVKAAMERIPGLEFSVSATTRAPRTGEEHGVHYHFMDRERFDALVTEDAFLEYATVYDRSYGTLRDPTRRVLDSGRSILLDIDVRGARQVREHAPGAVHLFVLPPSIDILEARLRNRATDDEATIARRMEQAMEQLEGCVEYDYVIVNDDLDASHAAFQGILLAETSRRDRRQRVIDAVLGGGRTT
ncbi:MAG: guanylate kinase [Alphaproteobacteria bacterium]|nr:guanylate kinase [Alphaproteobacteria bacterium]MCB9697852.1 guanylate kinase [Alphaproteobacteria bacterium]